MGNILSLILFLWRPRRQKLAAPPQSASFSQLALEAAHRGDVAKLRSLLTDPSVPGRVGLREVVDARTGTTLLHVAMERGDIPCLAFLLSYRCSLNKGDHSAETPIHVACMRNRRRCLEVALTLAQSRRVEVDLDKGDIWGRTPLLKAMAYSSEEVVTFLLTCGVKLNLDAQDSFHLTAVHMAASRNRLHLVRLLAERGASLDLLQYRGHSALCLVIASATPSMVRELLTLGASTCSSIPPLPLWPPTIESTSPPCMTAIQEFVRRSQRQVCERSEEILHLVLAAHGQPLPSGEPDVFHRVLFGTDLRRFLPLLYKMMVCSDTLSDDLNHPAILGQGQGSRPREPLKLVDLARRSARQALMASGRNVLWATDRLSSSLSLPPAVKGLLLLKDFDHKDFRGGAPTE